MKAISLWQPWASAMALGVKKNETRGWWTNYRGDLVICSSKRKMTKDDAETLYILVDPPDPENFQVPYGMALCVVTLCEVIPSDLFHVTNPLPISPREASLGNYEKGRWIWITTNLRRLNNPVPVRGRQGLFNLSRYDEMLVSQQL